MRGVEAQSCARHEKLRVGLGDDPIRGGGEAHAGACDEAFGGDHNELRQLVQRFDQVGEGLRVGLIVLAVMGCLRRHHVQIHAGAERALGAFQEHDADVIGALQRVECFLQRLDHLEAERIALGRPVDEDDRDAVRGDVEFDMFTGHGASLSVCCCCQSRQPGAAAPVRPGARIGSCKIESRVDFVAIMF